MPHRSIKPAPAARPTFRQSTPLRPRHALSVALACALLLPTLHASANEAASAHTSMQHYAIAAGPLADVVAEFSALSGVQLAFNPELLAGRHSPGLDGSLSTSQGFARLLAGSGYEAVALDRSTYGLRAVARPAAQPSSEADTLPTLLVQGHYQAPSALTGEYAGGQTARGGRLGFLGNRSLMDSPFTQTNYTAGLIQNQQSTLVSQVLDNDPSAQSTNGAMGHDGMNIRGFNVGNGFALFNGMQNIVSGTLSLIPAESFERIEVLKGPNALLNGSVGKIGGAINLVPKRAGATPLTQLTIDHASSNQLGAHVDVGRRFGQDQAFGVRANAVYRDGDSNVDHLATRVKLFTAGLDYTAGNVRLEADLGHQDLVQQGLRRMTRAASGVVIPDAPDNHLNWFDPDEFATARLSYGVLRGEWDISPRLQAYASIGGSDLRYSRLTAVRTIINNQGDLAAGRLDAPMAMEESSRSIEAGLRSHFTTGAVSHELNLGYTRAERDRRRNLAVITQELPFPASNIYHPVYAAPREVQPPDFSNLLRSEDATMQSLALVDILSMRNDSVLLIAGARYQEVTALGFNRNTGAQTSAYKEDRLTPMAGVVVKPRDGLSLYANYIEGLQQGATAPLDAVNAGQVFSPYVTKQIELGAKRDFGRYTTTVALYQIAQPSAYTSPDTLVFSVDGEQRHRGVDFNVFGKLLPTVSLLGGVAFIDSELVRTQGGLNDGNHGVGASKWRAVLGSEWETPLRGLTLNGRLIRTGSAYMDAANTQRIPHWTRLDLGARYQASQALTLRATVENVLDRSYWTTSGEGELALNLPRTVKLSASYDF